LIKFDKILPMLKRSLFLVIPLLLIACDLGSLAAPTLALPSPTSPPTLTSTPIPATLTLTPSPTDTVTLTDTLTFTPTETSTSLPTGTPTATPNLFTYVFPVQPPHLADFSKGGHAYPATDIFAPFGTKFVAVTSGTIDEVSTVDTWDPATHVASASGGLSVRILGDDGLHYYGAHLSAIAWGIRTGVWVPAGQLLGRVGNTGDARFTNPHVHFEVSIPEPPFTKLDPFPLLTAWRAGLQITPPLPTP
jgi:murein DD-endopeptidase MepM/ murein hydrolase activator NlpD